jgi:hypothetical protein
MLEFASGGLEAISGKISRESRINYLTNLFQGRQREFARGGGGANLSADLQQQARNTRAAFDLASAGGRENLQLMQRLATEMAGIVRQQNEVSRLRAGRSTMFEAGRRGQERITDLSRMAGADPGKIRQLRSQATSVISAQYTGDIAGARDLARRMNASIMRYTRELDAAARDLQQQQRAGLRNLNVRQSWATGLEQLGETATAVNQRLKVARTNQRASWTTALEQLGDTATTINQRLRVARTNQRASWATGLEQLGETATVINQRLKVARTNQRASWTTALEQLGDTATTINQRLKVARTNQRASWATGLEQLGETATTINQRLKVARTNQRASWATGLEQLGETATVINQRLKVARANQRASWTTGLEQLGETATVINQRLKVAKTNQRASWAAALEQLGENATTISQRLKVARTNQRASWATSLEQLGKTAAVINQRLKVARTNQRASWATALEQLGETATAINQRLGARNLNVRQSWAAALQDIGAEQQIRARALPDRNLLAQRVAASGQVAPTRLDDLRDAARKAEAEAEKRAAGSTKRYADAVEREAKRLERLGIGQGPVRGPGGAVPMGGQSRGGFNQLPFPAGPGNARGIAQFQAIQRQQRAGGAQGFFQGDARKAISEGLIGGAFPLLFGQGLGASIGGAAGGVSGGLIGGSFGFGLSLIGTALGSAVDTTTNNLKELAASLKSPNDAITALEASGFRVGDSLKFQVEQLQSVGRAYDAQTLVLQEVERRLGAGSVQGLNALNAEQKRLNESWAELTGALQSQLIPALVGFTNGVNEVIAAVSGLGELPVVKQLLQARGALASTPLGRVVVPFALAEGQFQAAQQRGRSVAATAPARVPLTPQEELAAESTRIQESRRVADQIRSAYREAFQLQRQAYDLQREGADINREIADYSYRKQREIFDLRQQVAEREIENNRAAAQNRIERSDLSARQTFAAATGFEQQLLTNVREVMRTRQEGEADIEQSRRKLELAMAKLNRDVEDYKRTNAREIEDIERRKLAYTRSVEDYKMNVADYVLQRAREAADFMRQAMTLPEVGGGGGAVGGGLSTAIDRIGGAYQFRGTELASRRQPGDYQSDPRENFFFDRRPQLIAGAKARIATLTQSDLAALAFTVLTEAGPTDIGKMDVAANLLVRSAALDNAPISAVAKQPGQYVGVNRYGRIDLESETRGRQVFGSRYDQTLNLLRGGVAGGAMPGGVVARTGATGIGTGAHLDVRWADGRPITAADADRFIRVAGKLPSSYGVTSGYGPRRAPVPGASTFHRGVDFATPAGQPITLTGGARLTGAMTEAQSGGGGIVGIIETPMGQMKLLHLERVLGTPQATAAAQVSNIPQPRFSPVAVGATPSAAPINAERMAVLSRMVGSEQEAQRILEEQNKLRQKGIELAQVEQILQGNQVPALEQEFAALQSKLKARRDSLGLSSNELALADLEAESKARIARIEEERAGALAKASKQYKGADLAKAQQMINEQSKLGLGIAKAEEQQKRENLELVNQIANAQEANDLLINARKEKEVATVENAALLRGELNASAVELARLSDGYKAMSEQQKAAYELDVARTEELRKQNEFRQQINQLQQERSLTGAGLRAGMIGEPARSFEQALNDDRSVEQANQLAQEAELLEDQQLIWDSLEKNIVDVSNAISGGLTNGLLDVISGAQKIEDVGREVLNGIARTFADTAQQQLSTLMQRKLASMLGGPEGPLTKMLGGASATAGPEALNGASLAASGNVWALNNAALAASASLQSFAAQAAVSSATSGIGSAFSASAPNILGSFFPGGAGLSFGPSSMLSGIGSAFSSAAPNILGSVLGGASPLPSFPFGGFLANGGTAQRGKGYVVGDGGEPEVFFPGATGQVVPFSDLENDEDEPEFSFAGAAGKAVPRSDMEKAAALQEGESSNEPIDIRYTVTEQRGERYVTEEQLLKSNAALAKRTQAMTYAGMRNNQQIREYAGL